MPQPHKQPHPLPQTGYLLDGNRLRRMARKAAALQKATAPGSKRLTGDEMAGHLAVTRAEIFLTSQCNMACTYCHSTAHDMPEWDDAALKKLLGRLANNGTRHVQWTGGEPTVLPAFVDLAAEAGRLGLTGSVSTNGTASMETYRMLVEAGIRRFYVSLDTLDDLVFDQATGTQGLIKRVKETIAGLCAGPARRRPHVTVNTMLTAESVRVLLADDGRPLLSLLSWLRTCGADDFKFLPATSVSIKALFPDSGAFYRFAAICRKEVPKFRSMFHYRLVNMQAGSHGLRTAPHFCYFCLDDRAFDSVGAYPCILHLREGGRRLFRHEATERQKWERLAAFFRTDRTTDPICRSHCFDLYRDLSTEARGMGTAPSFEYGGRQTRQ